MAQQGLIFRIFSGNLFSRISRFSYFLHFARTKFREIRANFEVWKLFCSRKDWDFLEFSDPKWPFVVLMDMIQNNLFASPRPLTMPLNPEKILWVRIMRLNRNYLNLIKESVHKSQNKNRPNSLRISQKCLKFP